MSQAAEAVVFGHLCAWPVSVDEERGTEMYRVSSLDGSLRRWVKSTEA